MNFRSLTTALAPLALLLSSPALADNIANCEAVLLETIKDENGNGGAKVASYRPATEFMESVYTEGKETIYEIDGHKIQAIMCKRFDVIPTPSDFKILATGVPFFLSQSFESRDSDLLSFFFKEGLFRHSYKGPGLSEETEALLLKRLAIFNAMEHDLAKKEAAINAAKEKAESEIKEDGEVKEGNKDKPLQDAAQKEDEKTDIKTDDKPSKTSLMEIPHDESEQSLTTLEAPIETPVETSPDKTPQDDITPDDTMPTDSVPTEITPEEEEEEEQVTLEEVTSDNITPDETSSDETSIESISSTKDLSSALEQSNESE